MSVHKYTFFLAKLKEGEDIPFLESAEGMQHEITPKSTVAIRDSESIFFREIRNNSTLSIYYLLDPLTYKYSRVWSSINFVDRIQNVSKESSCHQG